MRWGARTARRSIYQHFPGGKAELVATSTAAAGAWLRRSLRDLEGQGDVASLVRTLVTEVAENLAANDYRSAAQSQRQQDPCRMQRGSAKRRPARFRVLD